MWPRLNSMTVGHAASEATHEDDCYLPSPPVVKSSGAYSRGVTPNPADNPGPHRSNARRSPSTICPRVISSVSMSRAIQPTTSFPRARVAGQAPRHGLPRDV